MEIWYKNQIFHKSFIKNKKINDFQISCNPYYDIQKGQTNQKCLEEAIRLIYWKNKANSKKECIIFKGILNRIAFYIAKDTRGTLE